MAQDDAMALFLGLVSEGRILVLAIKDEGSFQLRAGARAVLARLGSSHGSSLGWRDMWAMVGVQVRH